jgi:membrane protein
LAKIRDWFVNHALVKELIEWTKEHSLPGFSGVPTYDVIVFVFNEIRRYDLFTRANSIAFSFFLSLFPSLLTLFTLAPFIIDLLAVWIPELSNFNETLYGEIKRIMPGQAGDVMFSFVQEVTNQPKVGLLSFGFLLAIYFSSNGMLAMMQGFQKSYPTTFHQRTGLQKRLVSIWLTGLLGLLVVSSVILVILGNIIIDWLTELVRLSELSTTLVDVLRWLVIIALYFFTIGTLYRYGAATYRRFRYRSPGVTLATILSLLSSVVFSFYVDEFNRYDTYAKFYGSIATVIIVMLWIQINSLILLIGFELNASIAINRDLKEEIPDD